LKIDKGEWRMDKQEPRANKQEEFYAINLNSIYSNHPLQQIMPMHPCGTINGELRVENGELKMGNREQSFFCQ